MTIYFPMFKLLSSCWHYTQLSTVTVKSFYNLISLMFARSLRTVITEEPECMLYSHDQLHKHICICMQNDNDTIKTSDTVLRKIYLPLYWKVVCERELETEQNCSILTPTLLVITTFLSGSPELLNRGPGGPVS